MDDLRTAMISAIVAFVISAGLAGYFLSPYRFPTTDVKWNYLKYKVVNKEGGALVHYPHRGQYTVDDRVYWVDYESKKMSAPRRLFYNPAAPEKTYFEEKMKRNAYLSLIPAALGLWWILSAIYKKLF